MNGDSPHRKRRFIEVMETSELKRRRGGWDLVAGWLELADTLEPGQPKALLEGDYIARTPDGTVLKEVTFKTEHASVEAALPQWSEHSARRWARIAADRFVMSDGVSFPLAEVFFEEVQ